MGFLATLAGTVLGARWFSASYARAFAGTARKMLRLLRPHSARFAGFPLVEVGGVLLSEEEVEHARRLTGELDK